MSLLIEEYGDMVIAIVCASAALEAFWTIVPALCDFANKILIQLAG